MHGVHPGVEAELRQAHEHLQPEDGEHEHALGAHRIVVVDGVGEQLDLAVGAGAGAHVVEVRVLVERHREHVTTADAEHPVHLSVGLVRVGHVLEHVGRQHQVDRRVVE